MKSYLLIKGHGILHIILRKTQVAQHVESFDQKMLSIALKCCFIYHFFTVHLFIFIYLKGRAIENETDEEREKEKEKTERAPIC